MSHWCFRLVENFAPEWNQNSVCQNCTVITPCIHIQCPCLQLTSEILKLHISNEVLLHASTTIHKTGSVVFSHFETEYHFVFCLLYLPFVWGRRLDLLGSEQDPLPSSCEHSNEHLRSVKDWLFLDQVLISLLWTLLHGFFWHLIYLFV